MRILRTGAWIAILSRMIWSSSGEGAERARAPAATNAAPAVEAPISVQRATKPGARIGALNLLVPKPAELSVETAKDGAKYIRVALHGRYEKPDATLLAGKQKSTIKVSEGDFRVDLRANGVKTPFLFTEIDPSGKAVSETVFVVLPGFARIIAESASSAEAKPARSGAFNVGLALTRIGYEEKNLDVEASTHSLTVLTFKAGYEGTLFASPWVYGISGFGTAMTLSTDDPDVSTRFLGINANAGYVIPLQGGKGRLTLRAGYYFTTMLVSSANPELLYGYTNIGGPEVFPTLRISLGASSLGAYFKFAPVSAGFKVLSLKSREVAGGISYSMPVGAGKWMGIGVDLSTIAVFLADQNEFEAASKTYSLGASFGF